MVVMVVVVPLRLLCFGDSSFKTSRWDDEWDVTRDQLLCTRHIVLWKLGTSGYNIGEGWEGRAGGERCQARLGFVRGRNRGFLGLLLVSGGMMSAIVVPMTVSILWVVVVAVAVVVFFHGLACFHFYFIWLMFLYPVIPSSFLFLFFFVIPAWLLSSPTCPCCPFDSLYDDDNCGRGAALR